MAERFIFDAVVYVFTLDWNALSWMEMRDACNSRSQGNLRNSESLGNIDSAQRVTMSQSVI